MGRPKGRTLPVRISVALSPAQFDAVSALAHEHSSTVSWVVRRAVNEFVAQGVRPNPRHRKVLLMRPRRTRAP